MTPLPGPPAIPDNGADIELIPLVRVSPRYPRQAARRQVEGFVKVEFTIAKDGSVRFFGGGGGSSRVSRTKSMAG